MLTSRLISKPTEDLDKAAAASLFAQNPKLVSLMQSKLSSLVGKPSGYIESLSPPVRRRVAGLKGVQKEHAKLEAQFQEEVLELEKKYFAKFTPLYQKRSQIVNGKAEPTEEEVAAGKADDEEEEGEKAVKEEGDETQSKIPEDAPGIPEFWLSAMKNQISLAELITDRDEGALKHLTDIRMEYLDRPGFRLIFEFEENEYFSKKTISKTYFYQEDTGYGGDFIYDHAEGSKIDWKPGQDLTVRIESKKQRNKSKYTNKARFRMSYSLIDTKQTRVVKKTVPTNSFFNFFNPPKAPKEEEEEDDDVSSDIEERLELDYQLGEDIKEKLIPRAIDWFTGEALQFEELEEEEEDMEDEDDDDDDDDDDDKSDEEESDDDVCHAACLVSSLSPNFEVGRPIKAKTGNRRMQTELSGSQPLSDAIVTSPYLEPPGHTSQSSTFP